MAHWTFHIKDGSLFRQNAIRNMLLKTELHISEMKASIEHETDNLKYYEDELLREAKEVYNLTDEEINHAKQHSI